MGCSKTNSENAEASDAQEETWPATRQVPKWAHVHGLHFVRHASIRSIRSSASGSLAEKLEYPVQLHERLSMSVHCEPLEALGADLHVPAQKLQ